MTLRCYRELLVWQKSIGWVERIYNSSRSFPTEERFGLTSQLRRAAVSVPCNIAEGAERPGTGEFLQFLGVARGSLAEAETLLILATNLRMLPEDQSQELLAAAQEIGRMLSGLTKSLKSNRSSPTTSH